MSEVKGFDKAVEFCKYAVATLYNSRKYTDSDGSPDVVCPNEVEILANESTAYFREYVMRILGRDSHLYRVLILQEGDKPTHVSATEYQTSIKVYEFDATMRGVLFKDEPQNKVAQEKTDESTDSQPIVGNPEKEA